MVGTPTVVELDWGRSLVWVFSVRRITSLSRDCPHPQHTRWKCSPSMHSCLWEGRKCRVGTVAGACHPPEEICWEVSARRKCETVEIPRGLLGKIDLGVGGSVLEWGQEMRR